MYTPKKFSRPTLPKGQSEKALAIHEDKLYVGYVNKKNEVEDALQNVDPTSGNITYSAIRSLKDAETFATNGVYLHEYYFDTIDGNGENPHGALLQEIEKEFGNFERFTAMLLGCGMAARGWVIFGFDTHEHRLKLFIGDAHNQGGVWGTIPLLVLDVYEHAYFMDYGSDRKTYIMEYMQSINWEKVEKKFVQVSSLQI